MSKLVDALCHRGPIGPQLEGPSDYQRNKQLVEIIRLARLGSSTHLYRMERMSASNKKLGWQFSKADTKAAIRSIYGANVHGK